MKNSYKKLLIFLVIAIATACSKSHPPVEPAPTTVTPPVTPPTTPPTSPPTTNPPTTPPTDPPTTPPVTGARLVPVKIESTEQTLTLKYLGNTALLTSIEESKNATKANISYNVNNELMQYSALLKNQTLYSLDYFRDANQRIYNVSKYTHLGKVSTPGGNYTLGYNDLNQIITLVSYTNKNILINTKTLGYDAAGNRTSITTFGSAEKSTFTFDQKNGIFKHVSFAQLISLEFEHQLLNSLVNNVLTMTGSPAQNNYSCTYEYQTDDFPTKVTITEAGVNTVFYITYKTL